MNSAVTITVRVIATCALLACGLWWVQPNDAADSNPVTAIPTKQTLVDFGVIGDGIADDTVAIQQAVEATSSAMFTSTCIFRIAAASQWRETPSGWASSTIY